MHAIAARLDYSEENTHSAAFANPEGLNTSYLQQGNSYIVDVDDPASWRRTDLLVRRGGREPTIKREEDRTLHRTRLLPRSYPMEDRPQHHADGGARHPARYHGRGRQHQGRAVDPYGKR